MNNWIKNNIAKRLIILRPLLLHHFFSNGPIKMFCRKIDMKIQVWALRRSDFFSKKDWEEIQFEKMKKILCHAYKNVPFWNSLFKELDFIPSKMLTIEDVKKIPVISRADLSTIDSVDLIASNLPERRFVKNFTSGSTGEPLKLFQDRKEIFRREINNLQEFRYMEVDINSPILIIGLQSHTDLDTFGKRINAIDIEDDIKRHSIVYPTMLSFMPRLLISTPSSLERLLFFCKKENVLIMIDKICYMGEMMSDDLKNDLESYFSSTIYSTYGTRECSLIGIQCREGSRHLAPWMNYVEIVNGEIVVTNFENEVMPFIRYSIGDEGELHNSNCKCGRSSKIINQKGRVTGSVKFSDGSAYYVLNILQYFGVEFHSLVSKFQIEQPSYDVLIVKYILKNIEEKEIVLEKMKKYFELILKNKIEISFFEVDSISPNSSGKTPVFIQRI